MDLVKLKQVLSKESFPSVEDFDIQEVELAGSSDEDSWDESAVEVDRIPGVHRAILKIGHPMSKGMPAKYYGRFLFTTYDRENEKTHYFRMAPPAPYVQETDANGEQIFFCAGEDYPLAIIPVAIFRSRQFQINIKENGKTVPKTLCYSIDGKANTTSGAPEHEGKKGVPTLGACKACPFSKWENKKLPCGEQFVMVFVVVTQAPCKETKALKTEFVPMAMYFKGTRAGWMKKDLKEKIKKGGKPYNNIILLGTKDEGQYHSLQVTGMVPTPDAWKENLAELQKVCMERRKLKVERTYQRLQEEMATTPAPAPAPAADQGGDTSFDTSKLESDSDDDWGSDDAPWGDASDNDIV